MLWIGVLLSVIIWAIGWESGFLGPSIHVFLLLALLAALASLLPPRSPDGASGESPVAAERQGQEGETAPQPGGGAPAGESETTTARPATGDGDR